MNFSTGFWCWLQSRMFSPGVRQHRRKNAGGLPTCSAEVSQLEVRQLLSVTYHGGAILSQVEAQPVYLGSDWQTNSALKAQVGNIDQFVSTLVQSPYMDMLNQAGYNVGRGTSAAGALNNTMLSKSGGVTDAQIQTQLQSMISSGSVQAPDANRLYIVYVEPGVVVRSGTDASNTTFAGYHGAFAGHSATGQFADIRYAVIPYPGAPNFSAGSMGFTSDFNELTSVTSHELSEAVTDPDVNYKTIGWYDDRLNGEIGDLTRLNTVLGGYVVQEVVDKNDRPIGPVAVQPPTPTLFAPQNVTITALSSTSAQLSWNSVVGTQGYRIYQVTGSQSVLLGTVDASTTSVNVTGLTAGVTTSLKIEAYTSSATADSGVVSVTPPAPNQSPLAAPQVTVTLLSSSSAFLTWNPVSRARGYRIYWLNSSNQRVLLGTVGATANSVEIFGLTPRVNARFIVEAFNSKEIAGSAPVSVTTQFPKTGSPFGSDPRYLWWL